jgi:hypothetical protein
VRAGAPVALAILSVLALCMVVVAGASAEQPAVVRTLEQQGGLRAGDAGAGDAGAASDTVTLYIDTRPRRKAKVTWGRETLGHTPLEIVRPRNSGPMDIRVRAWGYIPVNTRLHTFSDESVKVRLTPKSEAARLFGYKQPLDAGVPPPPDGGLPASQPVQPVGPAVPSP